MHRVCPECQRLTTEATCPHDGKATVEIGLGSNALVGQVISARYRLEELVGEGGFGAVYRAVHTGTGDVVAIKVLRNDQQASPEMAQRFQQEASVTAKLKQPHTVRVFDFGQMDSGDLFIAMEFLEGRVLTKAMAAESPMHYRRLANIASQVLKSLAEAHEKGLVHRDLKPDNIFLQNVHGEEDFVKVLDFGIAKSLLGGNLGAKTATGVIIGTPPYMSPEQARGTGVDARTDIYAMGCILYEALTCESAFPAESPIETLIRRITEPPPRTHGRCKRPTPDAFCDVVLKAMATQPEQRYATAIEMARALTEASLAPEPAATVDPGAWDDTLAGVANVVTMGSGVGPAQTGRAPSLSAPPPGTPEPTEAVRAPVGLRPVPTPAPTHAPTSVSARRPGAPTRPAMASAPSTDRQKAQAGAARPVAPVPTGDEASTLGMDVVAQARASTLAVSAPQLAQSPAQAVQAGGGAAKWLAVGLSVAAAAAAAWWFLGRSAPPPQVAAPPAAATQDPAPAATAAPAAAAQPAQPAQPAPTPQLAAQPPAAVPAPLPPAAAAPAAPAAPPSQPVAQPAAPPPAVPEAAAEPAQHDTGSGAKPAAAKAKAAVKVKKPSGSKLLVE